MKYRAIFDAALDRFRKKMLEATVIASESELVNFFEKWALIPELLSADPDFDIGRVCRESHVRNPFHIQGEKRGKSTYRRKADLAIWPANRLTTYGDDFTDPKFAPDALLEFKVHVGDRTRLSKLQQEYEADREKVRLACEQSPGLLGCTIWIDVPQQYKIHHEFHQIDSVATG